MWTPLVLITFSLGLKAVAASETLQTSTKDVDVKNKSDEAIIFYVDNPLKIMEKENKIIPWSSSVPGVEEVLLSVKDEFVSVISGHEELFGRDAMVENEFPFPNSTGHETLVQGYVNMTGKFIGFNSLHVTLLGEGGTELANGTLKIGVTLLNRSILKAYELTLTVMLVIVYINMGASLDLELVKSIIKKPIGPAIGLFCQYICMPLIAFGLGLLFFPDDPLFRLGLFASGSSPGGGLSNMWTLLLGGSLDLSIMMTFASTVAALGTVPFWLLTLGRVILQEASFVIPYANVIIGIAVLILPCFVGIFIQIKLPKLTKMMRIILTPLSVVNISVIIGFGVYANLYLFSYMTFKAILAGFCQTIIGHIAGFVIAYFCRRSLKEMIAISVETAVQNNQIAFILLKLSLGKPEGDMAVLLPGCVGLFTPCPLIIAILIRFFYLNVYVPKCGKIKEKDTAAEDGKIKEKEGGRKEYNMRQNGIKKVKDKKQNEISILKIKNISELEKEIQDKNGENPDELINGVNDVSLKKERQLNDEPLRKTNNSDFLEKGIDNHGLEISGNNVNVVDLKKEVDENHKRKKENSDLENVEKNDHIKGIDNPAFENSPL